MLHVYNFRGYPEPTVVWRREDGALIALRTEDGQRTRRGELAIQAERKRKGVEGGQRGIFWAGKDVSTALPTPPPPPPGNGLGFPSFPFLLPRECEGEEKKV